ncbi:MAG: hypothetical protein M1819_003059 [Sarea resinae]|nr:MAG: hypothetical protein M1819_003059 [Sarea resinae]
MAHFLRGRLAGIQNDFSAGISPELFMLDDVARFGINSQMSALAYDPVQGLLAVGTNETQYGSGQVYVFGQKRVSVSFTLPRKASIRTLQFCADKLISLDSQNELVIYSLPAGRRQASYTPPGIVTALLTDPSLDWIFLGLQNGDIVSYDLDREVPAPFKIPNLWRERNPRARLLPVISLSLHPRDIGTLLVGYGEGAAIYSFKENAVLKFFSYEVPPGAPGGDSDPSTMNVARHPKLTHALWHPIGTFILTGHEDGSLVFWDPKDGRLVMARTLQDRDVDKPGTKTGTYQAGPETFTVREPLIRIAWCCKKNPDDTGILVAGGAPARQSSKGLTFLDLGGTPIYATSSWQALSDHFGAPKRQFILETPAMANVVDFCLIPRFSPYYAGAQDPIAVMAQMSSGEVITLSFPNGHPISPTNQLHVSMSFVHPFVNKIAVAQIERGRWLGMTESRQQGPPILRGGAEAPRPLKRFEGRNIIQTAHADGTIRLWDTGHADEIENEGVLQVDVARALGRLDDVEISQMSLSGATAELAVGMQTGEVVIFRWDKNQKYGLEAPMEAFNAPPPGSLTIIKDRTDPGLKEGLLPFVLLDQRQGRVSAIKMSDVGFAGIGYENGSVTIIDMRGPAVIFQATLADLISQKKHGSLRRRSNSASQGASDYPTLMEFGVMTLEGEDYSSILLFVGTKLGRIATFKLLPEAKGGYSAQFAGSTSLEGRVISICPVNADTGGGAYASQNAVGNLRNGIKVNGVVVAVTPAEVRIFKPTSAKGAHKTWDRALCDSAGIVRYQDSGYALVGFFGDGFTKAFSLPGLKELGEARVDRIVDVKKLSDAVFTKSGDALAWTGPSELAFMNVWGTGQGLMPSNDRLFDPQHVIPPRPTISNLQWISGTQYVTPADMDTLIGGPGRKPSRRMLEQSIADEQQRSNQRRPTGGAAAAQGQDESYWQYMQRQLNERTEKLGIMGDSMDRLEESSMGWADDVNKFVSQTKRKVIIGGECFPFPFSVR